MQKSKSVEGKKSSPKPAPKGDKTALIDRLISKAELDFRCCGHGGHDGKRGKKS